MEVEIMRICVETYEQLKNGTLPVEERLRAAKVPGATVAVIRGGEIVFSGAYGTRDDRGTPMTLGTLFEAASLTKSLFATLALREIDAGRLGLDEPIAPKMQGEPWSDDPRYAAITPRQVLSHGSGLPNWEEKPMKLCFAPGTGYSYSGEGYYLLQHLVEQLEGKSMDTLFRENFFLPWGMDSSKAEWTPMVGAAFSMGFDKDGKVTKVRDCIDDEGLAPEPNAAWSLYTYAVDYARFLCRMIRERGGLSETLFAEMTKPQNEATPTVEWGLGFGIPKKDRNVLWHWGDNRGFKSFAVWDKVTGDGAVICTNSDNGVDFYLPLLKLLTDGAFYDDVADFIAHAE